MSEPYIGEIRMFAGSYAPRYWAFCDGQLLSVAQNGSLFSLFHTRYGGDGITTFGVPDIRGRLPIHFGTGYGLTTRPLASRGGFEYAPLSINEMPTHDHVAQASNNDANSTALNGKVLAKTQPDSIFYGPETSGAAELMSDLVLDTGGNQPHYNLMPALCVTFIVSLAGTYPPRN